MKFTTDEKKAEQPKLITLRESADDINICIDGDMIAYFCGGTEKLVILKNNLKDKGIEFDAND